MKQRKKSKRLYAKTKVYLGVNMELWDVYDINRNKANKTMVRGEPFEIGNYHLVIHVCIFNSDNKMLIQQRQPFKEGWPNM
jgi:isopentenyldiphosphate isomerase